MNRPGGVSLLYLSLAQTARLGALIRDLGLEGEYPDALHDSRDEIASQNFDPIDAANAAATDLIAIGLRDPLLAAADRWLAHYQGRTGTWSARSTPRPLSRSPGIYVAAGRPDRAGEAARAVLDSFRLIQPPKLLIDQARKVTQETIHAQKQKEIDAFVCRRVRLRCAVARLGLGKDPLGPGDAKSLLEDAWAEALTVVDHASRGDPRRRLRRAAGRGLHGRL